MHNQESARRNCFTSLSARTRSWIFGNPPGCRSSVETDPEHVIRGSKEQSRGFTPLGRVLIWFVATRLPVFGRVVCHQNRPRRGNLVSHEQVDDMNTWDTDRKCDSKSSSERRVGVI